jgi:hypothetical protein
LSLSFGPAFGADQAVFTASCRQTLSGSWAAGIILTVSDRRRLPSLRVALVALALVVVAVVGVVAVRSRLQDRHQSAATIRQWVAVLAVGPDARSLYASAADVGKVAGVYVFVDRWACYEGFPAGSQPSGDEWFLGVAASERGTVDGIVTELARTPIVEAEVEQGCALPPDTTPIANQT